MGNRHFQNATAYAILLHWTQWNFCFYFGQCPLPRPLCPVSIPWELFQLYIGPAKRIFARPGKRNLPPRTDDSGWTNNPPLLSPTVDRGNYVGKRLSKQPSGAEKKCKQKTANLPQIIWKENFLHPLRVSMEKKLWFPRLWWSDHVTKCDMMRYPTAQTHHWRDNAHARLWMMLFREEEGGGGVHFWTHSTQMAFSRKQNKMEAPVQNIDRQLLTDFYLRLKNRFLRKFLEYVLCVFFCSMKCISEPR